MPDDTPDDISDDTPALWDYYRAHYREWYEKEYPDRFEPDQKVAPIRILSYAINMLTNELGYRNILNNLKLGRKSLTIAYPAVVKIIVQRRDSQNNLNKCIDKEHELLKQLKNKFYHKVWFYKQLHKMEDQLENSNRRQSESEAIMQENSNRGQSESEAIMQDFEDQRPQLLRESKLYQDLIKEKQRLKDKIAKLGDEIKKINNGERIFNDFEGYQNEIIDIIKNKLDNGLKSRESGFLDEQRSIFIGYISSGNYLSLEYS